jgi:AraC-like DNA-binding protein
MPYDNVRPDIYVVPVSPALQSLTDSIRNHCMMNTSLFEFSSSLLIHSLVLQLLTGLPKNIWPGSDIDPRILKVIAYIDRNRDKKILNGTLAAMVNMATNSFARFFSQQTGDTVQVFLMKHRIEQARLMLHHGNENIDSIALECGFCDRHHFSKVFKSFTGVSPAYYKKNHTVEND